MRGEGATWACMLPSSRLPRRWMRRVTTWGKRALIMSSSSLGILASSVSLWEGIKKDRNRNCRIKEDSQKSKEKSLMRKILMLFELIEIMRNSESTTGKET